MPAEARYTLSANRVPGLANTLYGAQLVATNGLGFIAEKSVYNSDRITVYGAAGLAQ